MEKFMKTEDGRYVASGCYTVAYEPHEDVDYIVYDFAGHRLEERIDRIVRLLAHTPEAALKNIKHEEPDDRCEVTIWIPVDTIKAYTTGEVSEAMCELMQEIARTEEMVQPDFVWGTFDGLMDAIDE